MAKILESNCLIDFFEPSYQLELIKLAQANEQTFGNSLELYRDLFVKKLDQLSRIDNYNNCQGGCVCYERKIHKLNCAELKKQLCILLEINANGKVAGNSLTIENAFKAILNCYNEWTNCEIIEAINNMEKFFDEYIENVTNNLPNISIDEINLKTNLYRARISTQPIGKLEMFHVPFNSLYKLSNQRFSLSGQPLLYLATGIRQAAMEVGCLETNLDVVKRLYISQYNVYSTIKNKDTQNNISQGTEENKEDKLRLFDLKIIPPYKLLYIAEGNGKENIENSTTEFANSVSIWLYKYILSCACHFPRNILSKSGNFCEEYVIPQLVMQILRKKEKYELDGICYQSTVCDYNKNSNRVDDLNMNIALFTNKNNIDNNSDENEKNTRDKFSDYDMDLYNRFVISVPISYRDISYDSFISNGKQLYEDFIKGIQEYFLNLQENRRLFSMKK